MIWVCSGVVLIYPYPLPPLFPEDQRECAVLASFYRSDRQCMEGIMMLHKGYRVSPGVPSVVESLQKVSLLMACN